jgi:hypothetical protein
MLVAFNSGRMYTLHLKFLPFNKTFPSSFCVFGNILSALLVMTHFPVVKAYDIN